jgi:hypothetical protein
LKELEGKMIFTTLDIRWGIITFGSGRKISGKQHLRHLMEFSSLK